MPNAIKRFHMLMKDKIRMVTGASENIRVFRYNNSIATIASFNQILPIIYKILVNFFILTYCQYFYRHQSDQIGTHNGCALWRGYRVRNSPRLNSQFILLFCIVLLLRLRQKPTIIKIDEIIIPKIRKPEIPKASSYLLG